MTFKAFMTYQIVRAGGVDVFAELVGVDARTVRRWRVGMLYPMAHRLPKLEEVTGVAERDIALMIHDAHRDAGLALRRAGDRRPLAKSSEFPIRPRVIPVTAAC